MTKTTELFNGCDLTGWQDHKNPHLWTAMDGMIVGTSEAGVAAAEKLGMEAVPAVGDLAL